jgi:hypothetical protein
VAKRAVSVSTISSVSVQPTISPKTTSLTIATYDAPIIEKIKDLCFSYNHWVLRFQFSLAEFFDRFNEARNKAIVILQKIIQVKNASKDPRLEQIQTLLDRIGGSMTIHLTNLQNRLLTAALEKSDTIIPYLKKDELISFNAWTSDPNSYAKTTSGTTIFADPSENTAIIYLDTFWSPLRWKIIETYIENISCTDDACLSTDIQWAFALQQFELVSNRIEMDCISINHVVDQLFFNRLPWTLPLLTHLELTINAIRTQYPSITGTVQDNINLLFRHPVTYLAVHPKCVRNPIPEECDFVEIQTLFPVLLHADKFALKQITKLPTFHPGIFTNSWIEVDSDLKYFLSNEQSRFKVTPDMYNCLEFGQYDCQLCYFSSQPQLPINECEQAMLEGAPTTRLEEICPTTSLPGVEQAYLVNNSWAFADATPGHITETCGAQTRTITLPPTGIITFDPQCVYRTVDTPIHLQTSFSHSRVEQIAFGILSNLWRSNGTLTGHLRDYIYHYLIPTSSAIVILILIVITLVVQRINLQRARRQRRRNAFLMRARPRARAPSPQQVNLQPIEYNPGIRFV